MRVTPLAQELVVVAAGIGKVRGTSIKVYDLNVMPPTGSLIRNVLEDAKGSMELCDLDLRWYGGARGGHMRAHMRKGWDDFSEYVWWEIIKVELDVEGRFDWSSMG